MKLLSIVLVLFVIISCKSGSNNSSVTSEDTVGQVGNSDSTYYESSSDTTTAKLCGELVKEILRSSPRYRQLTKGLDDAVKKNGGQSVDVALDKSPDPKKDNAMEASANYEMQVFENYPNRQVNIAHFVFDPEKQQLYEYDVVKDQLVIVDYNKDLLTQNESYCK